MLKATNMLGKDNPRWGISNAIETIRVPGGHLHPPASAADAISTGYGRLVAWLTGLPRRAGRRLFAMNDAEAGWHRWRVTELRGGLGRGYRDRRFDLFRAVRTEDAAQETMGPPATLDRGPGDWDDVHGWPWGGEA